MFEDLDTKAHLLSVLRQFTAVGGNVRLKDGTDISKDSKDFIERLAGDLEGEKLDIDFPGSFSPEQATLLTNKLVLQLLPILFNNMISIHMLTRPQALR